MLGTFLTFSGLASGLFFAAILLFLLDKKFRNFIIIVIAYLYVLSFVDTKYVMQFIFSSLIVYLIYLIYKKHKKEKRLKKIEQDFEKSLELDFSDFDECMDDDKEIEEYKEFLEFKRFYNQKNAINEEIFSYEKNKCLYEQKYYDDYFEYQKIKGKYKIFKDNLKTYKEVFGEEKYKKLLMFEKFLKKKSK